MKLTLEQARMINKLSRKEAAKLIGVSDATILNWETYKTYPSMIHIPKIVEAYKLESVDDIVFSKQEI